MEDNKDFPLMNERPRFSITSALQTWEKETSLPSIPTFSHHLDEALGTEGIQLGSITELIGLPGSGKTQLCIQLCAAVQIPTKLGGLDSEAVFVNTNGNFSIGRFKEMLIASQDKCKKLLGEHDRTEISIEKGLERLHYLNGFELEEFLKILKYLPRLLVTCPTIKLIVIDSIIFPFKEHSNERERTAKLFQSMARLQEAASQMQVAIVLTNEMTTRLGLSGDQVVGALGDSWAHRSNVRILLSQQDGERFAAVVKTNVTNEAVCGFKITEEGIRDIE